MQELEWTTAMLDIMDDTALASAARTGSAQRDESQAFPSGKYSSKTRARYHCHNLSCTYMRLTLYCDGDVQSAPLLKVVVTASIYSTSLFRTLTYPIPLLPYSNLPHPILPIFSDPTSPYGILTYPIILYITLPYPNLPLPTLLHLTLPTPLYLTLSYPNLLHLTIPHFFVP